jgi:DNA-binding IclR family transcriptional regulator
VRSVGRALAIVQVLADAASELGISEIGRRLGLSKATVYRLLSVLASHGIVRLNPDTRAYGLGFRLLQFAAAWLDRMDIRTRALPHLQKLREKCDETISLNLLVSGQRVAIERLDSSHEMRFVVDLGKPLPLTIGAAGKVLLAFLPDEEIRRQLRTASPTLAARLRQELPEIRRRGFATSQGERIPGSGSVSAPIRDHGGRPVASVSILAPATRFTDEVTAAYQRMVVETVDAISRDLGHHTPPDNAPERPATRRRRVAAAWRSTV